MKKTIKILNIALIIMMSMSIVSNVFAFDPISITPDTSNTGGIQNIGEQIVGVIQVVGTIASVAMLVVLGVKYMMGSAEEKAEYKKTFIPYFVGAILVFAAVNVASMIYGWADQITVS